MNDYCLLAGWGTPSARDHKDAGPAFEADPSIVPVESRLARQATLVGWATPTVGDASNARNETANRSNADSQHHPGQTLCDQVVGLAGWQTPTTEDAARNGSLEDWKKFTDEQQWSGCRLRNQVQTTGPTTTSSSAETKNTGASRRGVLNPAFSLWLQGYPLAWLEAGYRAAINIRSRKRTRGGSGSSGASATPSSPR